MRACRFYFWGGAKAERTADVYQVSVAGGQLARDLHTNLSWVGGCPGQETTVVWFIHTQAFFCRRVGLQNADDTVVTLHTASAAHSRLREE